MGWRERAREEQEEGYEFMRRMGFTPFSEKKARAEAAENNRRPVEPEVGVWDTNLTRRTQSAINPDAVTDPLYDAALRKAENDMSLADRQSRTRALLEQTARDINSQKADAYTNLYRDGKTISNDFGNERIKEMNDTKSGYLLDNYMSGGANFMGGLANVPLALGDIVTGGKFDWDNKDIRKNPTANIDLLNEAMYEADKDGTPLPKFAGDLAQSAGQLVPQMLIGAGTGLGTELMAAGVFGNEYKQNRKDDMSVLASAANAGLKAGSEYVTEKLLGVLGKGAFKTVSKIAPKVISNPVWTKFANSYGGKIAEGFTGEFAEEAVQEPISLLIDKITGKEVSEEDIKNLPQNMLYSGLLGGITGGAVSGVAGLPHIGLNKRIEETGKQFNNTDTVNSIVSKGLESDKKGGFYRTAEALKKKLDTNQKITDYEVGNLIFNADEQTIDRLYNPMGENGEKQYNAQLKRRQSAQNGEVQQGDFEQEFGYYYRAGKDDVPYDKVPEYAGERSMDDVARAGAYYSGQNDMQAEADTLGTETNARRFYENVDKVFKGEISEREVIKIGKTPQILQDYGAKDLPITINQSTMYKIAYPKDYFGAKDQGHNLGIPSLKRLPSQIADPVAILKSKSQDNSLVLLTAWKDTNKYPVIVPLHLDKNSIIGMSNDIVSAYGKQNFNALLTDEKGNSTVLYTKNNEDIHQLLQSGLQLPGVVSDDTLINKIISQDGENVNNIVNWDINGAKGSGEYIGTVENNGKRFARVKMQNGKTADIDMAFVSDVDNVDNVVADTKNVPSDTKNVYSDTENGVSDTEKAVSKSESKTSTTEKTASAAERNISPRVTKKEREFFDKLSKAINTPIEFVDSIKSPSGQAANGAYVNGKIILAEDSDRPLIEVAKHEITHMLKENAPKEYAAYESYAIEALKKNGRYDDLYREYSELYGTDNESAINEELAADATQMFLTDEAAINELAQENPGLAKKFLDCIRGFIEKIKRLFADGGIDEVTASFETEQLKNAEKLWIKAIAAAEQGQSGNNKNGGNVNSETKFSLKKPVEETKDLIAVHNLNESKLTNAFELGGLVMPSIAITKSDFGHEGFGDITLIFDKSTIDPELNEDNRIYGGDAYTPMFPTVINKPNEASIKALADRLGTSVSQLTANYFDEVSTDDAARKLGNDIKVKEAFARENGLTVTPVLRDAEIKCPYNRSEKVKRFIMEHTFAEIVNNPDTAEEYITSILGEETPNEPRFKKKMRENYARSAREDINNARNNDEKYNILEKMYNNDVLVAQGKGVKFEDDYSYRDGLDNLVDEHKDEYDKYVRMLAEGVMGGKYIRNDKDIFTSNGNRRGFDALHEEYNIENVLNKMKSELQKGQSSLFTGSQNVRGAATKEFNDIQDLKEDSGRLKNLSDDEVESIRNEFSDRLYNIIQEAIKGTRYDSLMALDDFSDVIIESLNKSDTTEQFEKNLRKYGKGYNITPKITKDITSLITDMRNAPVKYFEAKPRRAVGFDEVKAAVVPNDTSEKIKQRLKNAGVRVIEYEKGNSRSRVDAVNSVDDIKFQLRRQESLERQNEKLRAINDSLREQFYLTEGIKVNRKQIDTATRKFLRDIHSKADKSEFSERLVRIYDTLANSNYDNEAYTAAMYELEKLTSDALHKSETIDDTLYKQYADLREHIRTTGITANESAKSDFGSKEDWNDFRKSNFGRIKIVNDGLPVDVFYKELSEMYPEWFSDEIQTQSDQLIRIANVLDGIKPVYENPYLMDIDEMSKTAAYELFTEFFGMGDQTTFADRKQAQMNNLKIKTKSQIAGLRQEYKTRNTKNILAQREKYQEHIRKLIDERDEKIKEIKLADSMHYGAEIANLKRTYNDKMKGQAEHYKGRISDTIARKNEKIEEVRQYYQERIDRLKTLKNARIALEHDRYTQYKEKTKERAAVREFKKKIKKDWYALSDMLLKPTDKKHIPEVMQKAVADFLGAVDIRSNLDDTKINTKLNNLYIDFTKFEENPDTANVFEMFSPEFIPRLEKFVYSLNEKPTTIRDMTSEQLKELAKFTKMIRTNVQNANKSFVSSRSISDMAESAISELKSVPRSNTPTTSTHAKARNAIEFIKKGDMNMLTPLSFFKQLGGTYFNVYWGLRKGLDKKIRLIEQTRIFLADARGQYSIDISKISGKKAPVFEFKIAEGGKLTMNKAHIMSLYLLNKREQAQMHIYGGGITFEDKTIKYEKKEIIYEDGNKGVTIYAKENTDDVSAVKVKPEDVNKIINTLSDKEKLFADLLGKFLSEDCAEWGNEVSLMMLGYKKFGENFYFPINTDRNYLVERFNNDDILGSISSMGFTKQTNEFANNPIIVGDIFDVFCRHVDDMSTYASLAAPVSDLQRIYNYKTKTSNMKVEIENAYGKAAKKYLVDFIKDVNGISSRSITGTLPSKLVGNVKAAAVGWNLRVVIQQPTAIFRATSMVDAKYFTQNTKNISVERMKEHSAIALYKSWGNYSLDMGRQIKEVITDDISTIDKIKEAGMWAAGKADDLTWSVIFNAVENEIQDTRKDLSVGSKAYWEAVEDRFDHVIDETQVVDSVFHRSALMRNEDGLVRQIMSFMGESTQSYNMVRRSAYDLYKHATPENKRKVLRAVSAFVVTTVVNSAIKSIVDSMRDDDDEKNFLEKWFKYFISGVWQEPFSMIPIVKDIVSIAQGYNVDRMDMSGIADIISSVTRAIKGGQTAGYSGFDIILSAVNASGIGAKNMFRELKSVEKMIIGSAEKVGADTDWIEYNLLKAKFNINNSKNRTKFYAQLYEAYDKGMEKGDLSTAKRILEDMVLHGIPVSGAVRNLDSRDKKALSKDKELVKIVEKAKTDKTAAVGMLSEFEKKNEGRYDDKIVEAAIKMIQKGISDVNYTPEDIYKTKQTNPEKALEMYYTLIELGFYEREDLDIALEIIKRRKARQ